MLDLNFIVEALKIIVTVAVFFVWFIRYDNIRKEFRAYGFPRWFRDLVGILKISFTVMLHSSSTEVVTIGSFGILVLMLGAVLNHIRMGSSFRIYIASVAMLVITSVIFLQAVKLIQ